MHNIPIFFTMMERFKHPTSCLLFFLLALCFTVLITSGKAETTTYHKEAPQNVGNNVPLPDSLPSGTPINKVPFAKPVGNNGKQSQLDYQQQQDPNYPQQGVNQPLSSGYSQPFPTTNQPLSSGYSQPFPTTSQPLSGFSQPFSSTNQPFGGTKQDGSRGHAAFDNGVPMVKICFHGVALVWLLTLMVCFGF